MTDIARLTGFDLEAEQIRPIDGGALGYYPLRAGESNVTDKRYPYHDIRRWGVVSSSVASQHVVINRAIVDTNACGGGELRFPGYLGDVYVAQTDFYTVGWSGIRLVGLSNITIVIEPGCTIKAKDCSTSNHSAVIAIQDCTNIRITGGGKIVGERYLHTGPAGEDGHGIALIPKSVGNTDITIENVTITSCYGDGLFVGIDDSADYALQQWNRNVVIRNVRTDVCRRQGMSVVNVIGMTIDGFTAENTGGTSPGAGIDFEPQYGLAAGVAAYAPVENVIGTNIRCENNVYGITMTRGCKRVRLSTVFLHNNSGIDLWLSGDDTPATNQKPNEFNKVTGVTILHDETVAPSPLPTAVQLDNGSYCRVADVVVTGPVLRGVYSKGSGVGWGSHTIDNVDVTGTSGTDRGIYIHNTNHKTLVRNCRSRGASVNLEVKSSDDVVVTDFVSQSSVGNGIVVENSNNCTITAVSRDSGAHGVLLNVCVGVNGRLTALRSATDGVRITAVTNSDLTINAESSSQLTHNTYANVQTTGATNDNRLLVFVRPGVLANKPFYGLLVNANSLRNDCRGSDLRGGHSLDYRMDDPTTIYERRPGVSSNRGDASVTLDNQSDERVQRFDTALTANRTVTLSTSRTYVGLKYTIVRTGLGAFTLTVTDGTTTFKVMPSATAATTTVYWTGSAWALESYTAN